MENEEFIKKSVVLLSQLSPEQRTQLVNMAQNFGSSAQTGASDRGIGRSMTLDEANLRRDDPDYGKSLEERFPNLNRLKF